MTPVRRRYREAFPALGDVQKSSSGVSYYSRRVNRPLGRRVAALGAAAGVHPDLITLLGGLCSLAGVLLVCLPRPSVGSGAGAALALAVGFVLDSADGQLARLQGGGSPSGELLDHLLDCAIKLGLHGAVLIALYRQGDDGPVLLLPLAFQFVSVLLFFGGTLVGKLREHRPEGVRRRPGGAKDRWTGLVLLPADHGALCLSFLLWPAHRPFLVVYTGLLVVATLTLVVLSRRWSHELNHAARHEDNAREERTEHSA